MNKIILVGRLTRDPESQKTSTNIEYVKFSVACKSKLKDEEGKPKVSFFYCVAWRQTAQIIIKYCKKGSLVQVAGSMDSRSYDKQDGTRQQVWEINVEDIEFLSNGNNGAEKENTPNTKSKQEPLAPIDDDDTLPF